MQTPTSFSPARDTVALCQQTFRALLQALARPCQCQRLPRELSQAQLPLSWEAAGIVLTLCDQSCILWLSQSLDTEAVRSWLRFHTGCVFADTVAEADFALAAALDEAPELASLPQGSTTYPDRSATLIVAGMPLAAAPCCQPEEQAACCETLVQATGPGIRGSIAVPFALTHSFLAQWQANHARFPQGVDVLFCGNGLVAGLPRSTRLQPADRACSTLGLAS